MTLGAPLRHGCPNDQFLRLLLENWSLLKRRSIHDQRQAKSTEGHPEKEQLFSAGPASETSGTHTEKGMRATHVWVATDQLKRCTTQKSSAKRGA